MGPARIYHWRKTHRSRAPSIAPGTFFAAQSWADCITNMPRFNLRQAQEVSSVNVRDASEIAYIATVFERVMPPLSTLQSSAVSILVIERKDFVASIEIRGPSISDRR